MPGPTRVSRTWILLALAAGIVAAPLAAQQDYIPPKVELSPFAGILVGSTLYRSAAGQTIRATSKATIGARLAWNVSPSFGVEASWGRVVPTLLAPSTALPGTDNKVGSVTIDQLDLSAILAYASPREALYFSLGGGFARIAPEITGATAGTDTRALLTIGVGYKRFFGGPVGFRADVKYHGIMSNRATDIGILCGGTTGCYVYADKKIFSATELTAGLVVRF
jgi:hypothetical protein